MPQIVRRTRAVRQTAFGNKARITTGRYKMPITRRRLAAFSAAVILGVTASGSAIAQKKYDTGATDTEIKIGNIMPYSGPASSYGLIGKTEEAYFRMIND